MIGEYFLENLHIFNNINFRIESSKSLANYKLSQSITLAEITKTSTHRFTLTAKELILAKYDAWFLFLQDVERIIAMYLSGKDWFVKFLHFVLRKYDKWMRDDERDKIKYTCRRNKILPADLKQIIKMLSLFRYRIYSDILKSEPEVFDQEYVKNWNRIHKVLVEFLLHTILDTQWDDIKYFERISYYTTIVLHHTLYEVYELDILFDKNTNFIILNYDDLIDIIYDDIEVNALLYRLEIYYELIQNLRYDVQDVKLKLYVDRPNDKIIEDLVKFAKVHDLNLIKE